MSPRWLPCGAKIAMRPAQCVRQRGRPLRIAAFSGELDHQAAWPTTLNSARVAPPQVGASSAASSSWAKMSQNTSIHIAFIPLLVPPLIGVMNELKMDLAWSPVRSLSASSRPTCSCRCGFGRIFLRHSLQNIEGEAGLPVGASSTPDGRMAIPAASMAVGCAIALLVSYRKPREYEQRETSFSSDSDKPRRDEEGLRRPSPPFVACVIQAVMTKMDSGGRPAARGLPVGLCMMLAMRVVPWQQVIDVFSEV